MIILTSTTDNLQAVLGGAVTTNQMRCVTSWRDVTTTAYTPGRTVANTNNTTDVNIVPAPAASTQRVVDFINVYNADTVSQVLTIKLDDNGTEYILWSGTLRSGEVLTYVDGGGWFVNAGAATPLALYNASTAAQGAGFSSDTYLTGSNILVPAGKIKVGTRYYCVFNVTKTAAGTATPIINLRFGTGAAVGDTSRGTFTFTAGTAAADEGVVECWATFRAAGATAILQSLCRFTHRLSVTGLIGTNAVSEPEIATSASFDCTVANSHLGLSVNGGASAAWTVSLVQASMEHFE